MRKYLALTVAAALLLAACKSTSSTATGGGGATVTTVPITDTRAPGVTDTTIKVGIVYVDLKPIESIVHINEGDFPKAYQALVDDINARGGIHGRKLVATIVGVNPTIQSAADQACTKLTQDEKVFVAVGFFLADNVLCYVDTNQTATIGGSMTPDRLAQAKAPWYTTDPGVNIEVNAVKKLAAEGKLGKKLAMISTAADEQIMNQKIKPALAAAGVTPISTAVLDAPTNDPTATYAQAATISERFKSAGADQVLVVGESGPGSYLPGLLKTNYRPQVVISDLYGANAYLGNKANDFSVLKNAISAGTYGPYDAEYALGGPTKACLDVQRKAGLVIKKSSTVPKDQPDQFVASILACQQMYLLEAILQKAGPTLNYGTFAAAGNSLGHIVLPGFPDPWDFGPPPNGDGNPALYIVKWNPATSTFDIQNS